MRNHREEGERSGKSREGDEREDDREMQPPPAQEPDMEVKEPPGILQAPKRPRAGGYAPMEPCQLHPAFPAKPAEAPDTSEQSIPICPAGILPTEL